MCSSDLVQTLGLLNDGATIPFISRYRKEATGSLDELQVGAIKEQLDRLTELEARRQTVLTTIEGQGKLTGELRKRIEECWDAVELEDIYLPYKPKRRTKAQIAREAGLAPLAEALLAAIEAHNLPRAIAGSRVSSHQPRRYHGDAHARDGRVRELLRGHRNARRRGQRGN